MKWFVTVVLAFGAAGFAEQVRVPISRDTWVSSVGGEDDANLGGSVKLKTKSYQEFTLIDIDPAPLRGRVIERAALRLHHHSGEPQKRLTVSTLAREWTEGDSPRYAKQAGSASFRWAKQDVEPWAWPGSDLTSVINGLGHTTWASAEATAPDGDGRQQVAVAPRVLAARVAGISHGFVVFDDIGSEWRRQGGAIDYHPFPNRFVSSRESGRHTAPYFVIELGPVDQRPPRAVTDMAADASDLPPGEAMVIWTTPRDTGPAGVIGFNVTVTSDGRTRDVPRYLIPMAGRPGDRVRMHLRDMALDGQCAITVAAVDAAGNVGPEARARIGVSNHKPFALPAGAVEPFTQIGDPPGIGLGGASVCIVDPLDKVQLETGALIPDRGPAYRCANHLWSAAQKRVRLHAGRNEFVAFNILLSGRGGNIGLSLDVDPPLRAKLMRCESVKTASGFIPDPLVPVDGALPTQKLPHTMAMAEVYVPHDAEAGLHRGELRLEQGGQTLTIDVRLRVWPFTLPDRLSFVPQMNCYGLPAPPLEMAYYRLAHEHRTCLNRLSYNWRGQPGDGLAPKWDGERFDFTQWDRRFGPLLDGSAFDDLPRRGVPVEAFYLPINENWPIPIDSGYQKAYWPDEALSEQYRSQFIAACHAFAEHLAKRNWHETFFEFYLNGKVYYKRRGWSRCSSPWIFDEPMHTQDFAALRWYGEAFREGVDPAQGRAKAVFRCDISRPQWQRDLLDGVVDVNVVGGAFHRYQRTVIDRKRANGEVLYHYGTTNAIDESNVQPAAWCVDAWTRGADGVLPWQTIGKNKSWTEADALALFYPGGPAGLEGPVPSIRLTGYRRGQQDVEYLAMLMRRTGEPRWSIGRAVRDRLRLGGRVEQATGEDAGTVKYDQIDPAALWRLRVAVGGYLAEHTTNPDAANP